MSRMSSLDKRLEALERRIKQAGDSAIWIDGHNATIRVDIAHRRGKEFTFPTVYEARCWLEKQINGHAGGVIGYSVDNICDLYQDAQGLRAELKKIMPERITLPDLQATLKDGRIVWIEKPPVCNHPQVFDIDGEMLTGLYGGMQPGAPADLSLWCLASLIERYCAPAYVRERWASSQLSPDDETMLMVFVTLFGWEREGSEVEILRQFARLLSQEKLLPELEQAEA